MSEPIATLPGHPPPPEAARAQLARIVSSPHFKNSRRCSALLEYVVEAACSGHLDSLKERLVGSAVFGREANYDTNQDAVVRNAAAEVRKRLAQYYLEPGRALQLRIDLPAGSYLPAFHLPAEPAPPPAAKPAAWPRAALAAAALGLLALAAMFAVNARRPALTALDRFWAPIVESPGEVQMCIGQSGLHYIEGRYDTRRVPPPQAFQPMRDRFVYMGDAISMARLNGYLYAKGKQCRYRGAKTTPYSELRGYPVVLIGMFNNSWTLKLTENLRYQLDRNPAAKLIRVRDTQGPQPYPFSRTLKTYDWDNEADFSIITRVFDPTTERWVVAAGGVSQYGTMSAGDFLTKPDYFREALRNAPPGWQHKNMQIVLETTIEGGSPGPPKVLATHFW